MIPSMPLPVVFALASAISPADAVAVSAIVSRLPVAKRLIHILEGESLLNDASGLVCMRFAIAAATTGTFSPPEASTTFVWIGSIGATIGKAMTPLATTGKDWISRRFGEETRSQILISLLIPFAAYMQAKRGATNALDTDRRSSGSSSPSSRRGRPSQTGKARPRGLTPSFFPLP